MCASSLYLHALRDHQAVENLQAEIVQLKQKISASEQRAVEVETLKCELVNATSIAERERRALEEATCARFSSLVKENERLAAKASSLALKFQETQNVIKVVIGLKLWDFLQQD